MVTSSSAHWISRIYLLMLDLWGCDMGKSKIAGGAGNRVSDSIEAYFYSDGERIPPDTLVGIENKSTSSLCSTGVLIDNTSTYKGGYTYVKTEDIDENIYSALS